MKAKAKKRNVKAQGNGKVRADLLAIAQGLGIDGAEVMSSKALKRAIKEAQATTPAEPLPPLPTAAEAAAITEAPAPQPAPLKKPAKAPRVPLTREQIDAKVAVGLGTIGQVAGAPLAGGAWESPAHRGHIVIGSGDIGNGFVRVHTVRISDGRTFSAKTKRIVRNIGNQTGYAVSAVARQPVTA